MCSVIGGRVINMESQKAGIISQHFVEQDGVTFVIEYLRISLILTESRLRTIRTKSGVVFIWPRAVHSRLRYRNVVKEIRRNARNLIDGGVNRAAQLRLEDHQGALPT